MSVSSIAQPVSMNKKIKRILFFSLLTLVTGCILLLANKNRLIRYYANEKANLVQKNYNLTIHFDDIRTHGFNSLEIKNLSIVPKNGDTLLIAGNLNIKVRLLRLLAGQVSISNLEADRLHLRFVKNDSISNFDFLYRRNETGLTQNTVEKQNYAQRTKDIFNLIFRILPPNATLEDIDIFYKNKNYETEIIIPALQIADNHFNTEIQSRENGNEHWWIGQGELLDTQRTIQAQLYAKSGNKVELPFIDYRWGAKIEFDTIAFQLTEQDDKSGMRQLSGKAEINGLSLFHSRISPEKVQLDNGSFDYRVLVGNDYIELDSTTEMRFNTLAFHPYLRIGKKEKWHMRASVSKIDFPADDLFSSLPRGLFYNLEGLKTSGTLSYRFLADLDLANPDSLRFESTLDAKNFKILQYGNTDLRKMSGPFTYTAYEQGQPVRSFEVGSGNPSFRPLNNISPLLQMAVMQSEDGAFFYHNGFLPECLREALVQDIKERRFVRGGSTISMQLIKNVFLNRNKTIARKLEEALIVWLIEHNRLTSKERMYEVYLNIVEWGPLVYGAQEASRYYFDKEAADLNLNEAIFLASIVPKPKRAMSSFTDSLQLKPALEGYYRIVAGRLQIKGLITESEAENIKPEIRVTGPARDAFYKKREDLSPSESSGLTDK